MGRLNWVLVLFIVSFSLLLVVPEPVTANTCTPTSTTNCVNVYCDIRGANTERISIPVFNGEQYTSSSQYLNQSQLGIQVTGAQQLQTLAATCVMPEFNTKYCTYRGTWYTNVVVNRGYLNSDNQLRNQTFILKRQTAFNCLDWIPPQLKQSNTTPSYETGARTVSFRISDDESPLVGNSDASNLSACAYRSYTRGTALPTTQLSMTSLPSGWTRIPDCTNLVNQTGLIQLNQANASNDFVIYAMDTDNNFVYHRINGTPMYPSLPLNDPQGFCPRQNECYVPGGTLLTENSFESIYDGTGVPTCVKPGETINDVYCDASRGLMTKSERLYEIARQQSIIYPLANITIYCSDINRIKTISGTLDTPLCSFDTQTSEENCMNACTMYVQTTAGNNAFFYSSVNRPTELRIPGILPTAITLSTCTTTTSPYIYLTCPYNFRGIQALSTYYYANQSLLHIGTERIGTVKNLSLAVANQLHNDIMIVNLRGNISRYYHEQRVDRNGYINPDVFEGKWKAYQKVAYRRNGDKTILGLRVDTNANPIDGEPTLQNKFIVGVIYHNYNGDRIQEYVNSAQNAAYNLKLIQVYRYGEYTVVVGSVANELHASVVLEQLVVRIRPGGLS